MRLSLTLFIFSLLVFARFHFERFSMQMCPEESALRNHVRCASSLPRLLACSFNPHTDYSHRSFVSTMLAIRVLRLVLPLVPPTTQPLLTEFAGTET